MCWLRLCMVKKLFLFCFELSNLPWKLKTSIIHYLYLTLSCIENRKGPWAILSTAGLHILTITWNINISMVLKNNSFPSHKTFLQPRSPSSAKTNEFFYSVHYIWHLFIIHWSCIPQNWYQSIPQFSWEIHQLVLIHKDRIDINLKAGVNCIPYEFGLVYIGETERKLNTRQKEHKDCCCNAITSINWL